jgi:O-methyltransferase
VTPVRGLVSVLKDAIPSHPFACERFIMTQTTDTYLDLLKSALCASLYDESAWRLVQGPMRQQLERASLLKRLSGNLKHALLGALRSRNLALVRTLPFDADLRKSGLDWPLFGYTMTGRKRLDALHSCIDTLLADEVAGDFIETGVWRGGSAILMRAILHAHGINDRIVWCADSFAGMPIPQEQDKALDAGSDFSDRDYLSVTLEQVQRNFSRFGLLDDQVRFLKGWFCDTLSSAPIRQLALLRLDGDLYESTTVALTNLYDKLSPGGYVIVDDYNSWEGCRTAVNEFRAGRSISAPLESIDAHAVMWRVQFN